MKALVVEVVAWILALAGFAIGVWTLFAGSGLLRMDWPVFIVSSGIVALIAILLVWEFRRYPKCPFCQRTGEEVYPRRQRLRDRYAICPTHGKFGTDGLG